MPFLLYILKVPLLTRLFSDHKGKFLVRHQLRLIGSINIYYFPSTKQAFSINSLTQRYAGSL